MPVSIMVGVAAVAAPHSLSRVLHQSILDRIAMHVAQLLHAPRPHPFAEYAKGWSPCAVWRGGPQRLKPGLFSGSLRHDCRALPGRAP